MLVLAKGLKVWQLIIKMANEKCKQEMICPTFLHRRQPVFFIALLEIRHFPLIEHAEHLNIFTYGQIRHLL